MRRRFEFAYTEAEIERILYDARLLADQAEAVVAEGLQEGPRSEVVLRFQVLDDNPEEEGGLVELDEAVWTSSHQMIPICVQRHADWYQKSSQ